MASIRLEALRHSYVANPAGPADWALKQLTLELVDRDTPDALPGPVVLPEPEPDEPRGCGCQTGPAPGLWWLALLAGARARGALAAGRRTGA